MTHLEYIIAGYGVSGVGLLVYALWVGWRYKEAKRHYDAETS